MKPEGTQSVRVRRIVKNTQQITQKYFQAAQ